MHKKHTSKHTGHATAHHSKRHDGMKKHHSEHEYKHASEHGGGRHYGHHMSHHAKGDAHHKHCVSGEMSWNGRPEYDSSMDSHWKGTELKGFKRNLKHGGSIK